jgi:hypothetical protein
MRDVFESIVRSFCEIILGFSSSIDLASEFPVNKRC